MTSLSCIKKIFLTSFLIGMPIFASAAGDSGGAGPGGGKGVVCRNADRSIKSVELLDLWEERVIRHENAIEFSGDLEKEISSTIERAKNIISDEDDTSIYNLGESVADELSLVVHGILGLNGLTSVETFNGVKLEDTQDSFESMIPDIPGCKLEQIVRYTHLGDQDHWQVNLDITAKMNHQNLIALGLHEAIYSLLYLRDQESNSLRVRRAVGYVMAGHSFVALKNLLQKPYIKCSSAYMTPEIAKEIQLSATLKPLTKYLFQAIAGGSIYFVQDPQSPQTHIKTIVNRIWDNHLIKMNNPNYIYSPDGLLDKPIKTFFNDLEKGPFALRLWNDPNDIEFNSIVEFTMKNGLGSLNLVRSTGVDKNTPKVKNVRCELVQ